MRLPPVLALPAAILMALALSVLVPPALATGAQARELQQGWPIDCTLGEGCFVQNHVDADPGPGAADFTCGPLSYDGHKGTDIALKSLAAMRAGVGVRASAPGVVRAVRDGEPDDGVVRAGKECGNGVLIDHGGGWQSQYCHMKQGSVAVVPGQRVTMGALLGQVGFSGQTAFPHLHFELRHDGETVDPYNADAITTCAGPNDQSWPDDQLWLKPQPYLSGGLVSVGLATAVPDFDAVKAGTAGIDSARPDAPALVVWAQVFGSREGDVLRLELTGPDGRPVVADDITLDRTQARAFRAIGRRLPPGGWPAGRYTGRATLLRDTRPVGPAQQVQVEVR